MKRIQNTLLFIFYLSIPILLVAHASLRQENQLRVDKFQNVPPVPPVLVFQTDNRLTSFLIDGESKYPPGAFSTVHYAVSPLAIAHWTLLQNQSYIFLASSTPCVPPPLISYWCKVPALLRAFQLASAASMEYLLYLDSDTIPGDPSISILQTLRESFERNPTAHILVISDSREHSTRLSRNTYKFGAINSGVIGMRLTPQTNSLLERWWYNLTTVQSPFDARIVRDTLRGWPGDQDRFNWLADLEPSLFAFEPALATGSIRNADDPAGHLVQHLCYDSEVRESYTAETSENMRGETPREEWESKRGWEVLRETLLPFIIT